MQLRSKMLVVALAVLGCMASSASAATVNYTLDLSVDNQWKMFASAVPAADNFGIALYSFRFAGSTITIDNAGPRTTAPSSGSGNAAGFTFLRTADNTSAAVETNQVVSASQDTTLVPNDHLIAGFGQEASNFAAKGITAGGVIEGNPWVANLLVGQGTYDRATNPGLTIDMASLQTFVNVFSAADNPSDEVNPTVKKADTLNLTVVPFGPPTGVAPIVADAAFPPPVLPNDNNANDPDFNPFTHQFTLTNQGTATQPVTWGSLQFTGYTPAYSGTGGTAADAAASLSSGGLFSWAANGAPRGIYNWSVAATNSAGSDTGTIQIHINAVPEPSTLALFGLAMVGTFGVIRRRNG